MNVLSTKFYAKAEADPAFDVARHYIAALVEMHWVYNKASNDWHWLHAKWYVDRHASEPMPRRKRRKLVGKLWHARGRYRRVRAASAAMLMTYKTVYGDDLHAAMEN